MSEITNQEILEEAKVFLKAMITSAKEEKNGGEDIRGMAYLPIRRSAYVDSITRGMAGRVRFHGKDGAENFEFDIAPDETVNEVLAANDLEEGVQGTPVFSIPILEDKEIWNMAISMALNILDDVRFLTLVTEAWASQNTDQRPSDDPDRTEILIGWSLSFDAEGKVIGLLTHMEPFEVKESTVEWDSPHIDFTDDVSEIMKQPQIAEILSRL